MCREIHTHILLGEMPKGQFIKRIKRLKHGILLGLTIPLLGFLTSTKINGEHEQG